MRYPVVIAAVVVAVVSFAVLWYSPVDARTARPAEAVMPDELVSAQRGTLPIILSAPHGGSVRVDGSEDRKKGVTVKDLRTAEIAWLTSQRLTDKLGAKVFIVVAQFSRKDADANRDASEAFENKHAAAQYDAYHRALREFVDEVRRDHARGLLIDIHGQAKHPDKVMRGTRDGKSVSALFKLHGEAAIKGDNSLFGLLAKGGYGVLPKLDAESLDESQFEGGYITDHYGSHNKNGVDTIQVEIGSDFRSKAIMHKTAEDLADAIAGFAGKYVLDK